MYYVYKLKTYTRHHTNLYILCRNGTVLETLAFTNLKKATLIALPLGLAWIISPSTNYHWHDIKRKNCMLTLQTRLSEISRFVQHIYTRLIFEIQDVEQQYRGILQMLMLKLKFTLERSMPPVKCKNSPCNADNILCMSYNAINSSPLIMKFCLLVFISAV